MSKGVLAFALLAIGLVASRCIAQEQGLTAQRSLEAPTETVAPTREPTTAPTQSPTPENTPTIVADDDYPVTEYLLDRGVPLIVIDETGHDLRFHSSPFVARCIANGFYELFLDALADGQPGAILGRNGDEAWEIIKVNGGTFTIKFPYTQKVPLRSRTYDLIQLRPQQLDFNKGMALRVNMAENRDPMSTSSKIIWDSNLGTFGFYFTVDPGGRLKLNLIPTLDRPDVGADVAIMYSFEILALLKTRPEGERWMGTGQVITTPAVYKAVNATVERVGAMQYGDDGFPDLFFSYMRWREQYRERYPERFEYCD